MVDSPAAQALARGLYYVLPNLSFFDVKARVAHGEAVACGMLMRQDPSPNEAHAL